MMLNNSFVAVLPFSPGFWLLTLLLPWHFSDVFKEIFLTFHFRRLGQPQASLPLSEGENPILSLLKTSSAVLETTAIPVLLKWSSELPSHACGVSIQRLDLGNLESEK
jgi:hypothetical protein